MTLSVLSGGWEAALRGRLSRDLNDEQDTVGRALGSGRQGQEVSVALVQRAREEGRTRCGVLVLSSVLSELPRV